MNKKLTRHFFILHTTMLIVAGMGVWYILKRFFPEILIGSYFVIPLFFYFFGLVFILIMHKTPKDKPKVMVNMFMMMRMVKLFASACMILIYWFLDKENIRSFTIIFIIFYLIYLGVETYIYMWAEMYLKKQSEKNSPIKRKSELK